jgi:hypothetical protein
VDRMNKYFGAQLRKELIDLMRRSNMLRGSEETYFSSYDSSDDEDLPPLAPLHISQAMLDALNV